MKAEFVLFGLMFAVEIFLNLKREATHEGEEQLMHSVKPGECRHLCCYSSMNTVMEQREIQIFTFCMVTTLATVCTERKGKRWSLSHSEDEDSGF